MKIRQLLIISLVFATALGGCSYMTVTTKAEAPADCTNHYTAPVADTLMTVPPLLLLLLANSGPICCGGGSGGGETPPQDLIGLTIILGSASVLAGSSAAHGYKEVKKCRTP